MEVSRDQLLRQLIDIQFERNDIDFQRGRFRVRGDVVEIFPASRDERALRVEFFGDEIDRIREVDALTGEILAETEHVSIFPATHFVTDENHLEQAIANIQAELTMRLKVLRDDNKLWKPSAWNNALITISRCYGRWVILRGLKTTPVIWMAVKKENPHILCWISSRGFFDCHR